MQIFASYADPVACANVLDDARVRKMIVETAQLLSIAIRGVDEGWADANDLYKSVPQGRELSDWAKKPVNMRWLIAHGIALGQELDERKLSVGKYARTRQVIDTCLLFIQRYGVYKGAKPLSFVNATRNERDGIDFKHIVDTHQAYKLYLRARWEIQRKDPRPHIHHRWTSPASEPTW